MLIYSKTYENIKCVGINFPIEDFYYATDTIAVVADGITRDAIEDFEGKSEEEIIKLYPRPSGASLAAKEFTNTFKKPDKISLKELFLLGNKRIEEINKSHGKIDYLVNDFYACVASAVRIEERKSRLYYSYLCDCGLAVFSKDGRLKFQTVDDMALVSKHFDTNQIPWGKKEARIIVRKKYRNNPNEKNSYGALTGEDSAIYYIKEGTISIECGDCIILYSDGLVEFIKRKDFFNQIQHFSSENFDHYIEEVSKTDYEKYGKEKTIVLYRI